MFLSFRKTHTDLGLKKDKTHVLEMFNVMQFFFCLPLILIKEVKVDIDKRCCISVLPFRLQSKIYFHQKRQKHKYFSSLLLINFS